MLDLVTKRHHLLIQWVQSTNVASQGKIINIQKVMKYFISRISNAEDVRNLVQLLG